MNNCVALLATFNGEPFVGGLLGSIDSTIDIVISDDNSTDNTLRVIEELQRENISIFKVNFRSAVRNFLFLIDSVPLVYDYYFLVDQDDIWCQGKTDKTLKIMHEMELEFGSDSPLLVFSDAKVVDENLNFISDSFWVYEGLNPELSKEFKLLCCQNVGQGATMVFNRALLHKVKPLESGPIMHDWWLMLCASKFGHIGYSREKTILYRQHDGNELGAQGSSLIKLFKRFFLQRKEVLQSIVNTQFQAKVFLDTYRESLSDVDIVFLEGYSSLSGKGLIERKLFCFKYGLKKSSLVRTIGFYLLV